MKFIAVASASWSTRSLREMPYLVHIWRNAATHLSSKSARGNSRNDATGGSTATARSCNILHTVLIFDSPVRYCALTSLRLICEKGLIGGDNVPSGFATPAGMPIS